MEWSEWVGLRGVKLGRQGQPDISDSTPSFALLDVQGPVIVTYVYQLVDGEVSHRARFFLTFRSRSTRSSTGNRSRLGKRSQKRRRGSCMDESADES